MMTYEQKRITELECEIAFLASKLMQIRVAAESCHARKNKHHEVHAAAEKVLTILNFVWSRST